VEDRDPAVSAPLLFEPEDRCRRRRSRRCPLRQAVEQCRPLSSSWCSGRQAVVIGVAALWRRETDACRPMRSRRRPTAGLSERLAEQHSRHRPRAQCSPCSQAALLLAITAAMPGRCRSARPPAARLSDLVPCDNANLDLGAAALTAPLLAEHPRGASTGGSRTCPAERGAVSGASPARPLLPQDHQ
jgi:hypothetical protein